MGKKATKKHTAKTAKQCRPKRSGDEATQSKEKATHGGEKKEEKRISVGRRGNARTTGGTQKQMTSNPGLLYCSAPRAARAANVDGNRSGSTARGPSGDCTPFAAGEGGATGAAVGERGVDNPSAMDGALRPCLISAVAEGRRTGDSSPDTNTAATLAAAGDVKGEGEGEGEREGEREGEG
jgi:hypothetical protein